MKKSERLYFLDNLKAFIILLVIILHAEICYSAYPFPLWLMNPVTHVIFTLLYPMTEQPLMTTMFFIAGYFTIPSFIKQGPLTFIKKKVLRLGIPLAFGIVTIIPIASYLVKLSEGYNEGFITFWTGYFTSDMFDQYHLWFLGTLLLFFTVTTLLGLKVKKLFSNKNLKTVRPSLPFLLAIPALTTILYSAAGIFTTTEEWTETIFIQFQNIRLSIYIVYFILGIYAYKRNWFKEEGYKPHPMPWAICFILSNLAYAFFYLIIYRGIADTHFKVFIVGISYCFGSFSGLLMFLGLFQRYCNFSNPLIRKISSGSYPAYIVHLTILFITAFLFMPLPIPLVIKFFTVTLISIGITWSLAIALKKIPMVKTIL